MRLKGTSLFGPSKRSLRPNFRDYQRYPDQSPGCWLRWEEGEGGRVAGMGHFLLLTFMAISRHMRSLASERAEPCGKGLKLKLTALSSRACRKAVCRIREASFVSLPLAYGPRPGCWVDNPPGRGQASPASSQTQFAHRLPPFPGPATASVGGLVC